MWDDFKSFLWRSLRERTHRDLGPVPAEGRMLIAGDSHAARLARAWAGLPEARGEVVDAGFPGHNTREYRAYLGRDPLLGSAFGAAVLWLGANDARADAHRTATAECEAHARAVLDRLRQHAKRVLLALPPPIRADRPPFDATSAAWLAEHVLPALRRAAAGTGTEVFEAGNAECREDGVHLTEDAYRGAARALLARLAAPGARDR